MKCLLIYPRVFCVLIVLLLSVVTTRFTGWPWICWYHDIQMRQFEHNLRNIPLPIDSAVLTSDRFFGLLWGNGNHCDAMVMILVESNIDEEGMSVFRTPTLKMPFSNGPIKLDLIRIFDGALYQVEKRKSWPIILSDGLYNHSLAPYDNLWESSDIKRVQKLVQKAPFIKNKQRYVFIARDSIRNFFFWLHRSHDLLDIRCH